MVWLASSAAEATAPRFQRERLGRDAEPGLSRVPKFPRTTLMASDDETAVLMGLFCEVGRAVVVLLGQSSDEPHWHFPFPREADPRVGRQNGVAVA